MWCRIALLGTVVCTALLILPMRPWEIIAIRMIAGGFSALALVSAAMWLFHQMKHAAGAPLLFAGVGAGILVSAEIIAIGKHYEMHSAPLWGWIAVGALLCTIPAWFAMHPKKSRCLPPPPLRTGIRHATSVPGVSFSSMAWRDTATSLPPLFCRC